jgi:PleD family two-component response regulator
MYNAKFEPHMQTRLRSREQVVNPMKREFLGKAQHTVLVVADDFRILALAQTVLAGKGHRVLLAHDTQNAAQILGSNCVHVHSVAVRAGMRGCKELQECALRSGAKPWIFYCAVDDRSIRLKGLDSGADWESAAESLAAQSVTSVTPQ